MPQLDLSTFAPQLFWLAVFFCLILLYSAKVTLPRLARVLRNRWSLIEGTQQIAAKLQEEAEDIAVQLHLDLERSRKRSHDQIVATSRQLSKELTLQKQELSGGLKKRLREHELRVIHKESQAMGDIQTIVQELTTAVVEKLLGGAPILSDKVKKGAKADSSKDKII